MANQINPKSLRVGVSQPWSSRWFFGMRANPQKGDRNQYRRYIQEDEVIRTTILDMVKRAGIAEIIIERTTANLRVSIKTARPGVVIGRGGEGIKALTKKLEKNLKAIDGFQDIPLSLNVEELKRSEVSSAFVAHQIVQDLERRMRFRIVLRRQLDNIMQNKEVKGAKIAISGRLDGAEIARREWKTKGSLPLQTIRADIDYAADTARTTYGAIGIKVWIYKGEVFEDNSTPTGTATQ